MSSRSQGGATRRRARGLRARLLPLVALALYACDGEDVPDCDAEPSYLRADLRIALSIDLHDLSAPRIRERITARAERAGRSFSLFGTGLHIVRADQGVHYDGQRATFCTDAYEEGDDVSVDVELTPGPASYDVLCGGLDTFDAKDDEDDDSFVYGPFSEPFCASQWLFVPQSSPKVDPRFADPPALQQATLEVVAPSDDFRVFGPNGRGERNGRTFSFAQKGPFPLYALGFAASPSFDVQTVGRSAAGTELLSAVASPRHAFGPELSEAALATVDFMESKVAAYGFDGDITLISVPSFPGGMEHVGAPWIIGKANAGERRREVVIHELVHQWWGNRVRFPDFHELWIAEGFTDWYTMYRILPLLVPQAQADAALSEHRATAGDLGRPLRPALDTPLAGGTADDVLRVTLSRSFSYGASFVEMIAARLQLDFALDPLEVLASWYAQSDGKAVSTEDLALFLGERTGEPDLWQRLFEDWVYSDDDIPELGASAYGFDAGRLELQLALTAGGPDLPRLRIAAVVDGVPHLADAPLTRDAPSATVRLNLPAAPERIVVDPDHLYIVSIQTDEDWHGPAIAP